MIMTVRNREHETSALTSQHESVKSDASEWEELTQLRRQVKRAIGGFALSFTTVALIVGVSHVVDVPNAVLMVFNLVVCAAGLYVCLLYAIAFARLVYWRCPTCGERFFAPKWGYHVPLRDSCAHCHSYPP